MEERHIIVLDQDEVIGKSFPGVELAVAAKLSRTESEMQKEQLLLRSPPPRPTNVGFSFLSRQMNIVPLSKIGVRLGR